MAPLPNFESEDEFKDWYLKLGSARDQIAALHEWRRRQSRLVAALPTIVRHLGADQYSEIDHFILEVLQNADDNTYAPNDKPTLTITLEQDRCIFDSNELGFTAENVFAVCYAAASTKKRRPGISSYIGEKGIGFKSLFAVAEAVEIHSGDFHFELRDTDYIVPYFLETTDRQKGSRIVIRLKRSKPELAQLLSTRLAAVAKDAERIVLFLQKIRSLWIFDRVGGVESAVEIDAPRANHVVVRDHKNEKKNYRLLRYLIEFPQDVVTSRFEHLTESMQREVKFAVPMPAEVEQSGIGTVFCFLPTRISSGFPFHVQLDGKTTTNRENLETASRSDWNRHLFEALPGAICWLLLQLREDALFSDYLPLYLPDPNIDNSHNHDWASAYQKVIERCSDLKIGRDRRDNFIELDKLRVVPETLAGWIERDQYAGSLESGCEFLHPAWKNYADRLEPFGCETLEPGDLASLMVKAGAPAELGAVPEEELARAFLQGWMDVCKGHPSHSETLRTAPIYPIKAGKDRRWGPVTRKTMVVSSDARDFEVPEGCLVVDPLYTYRPGGGADETKAAFNTAFRGFLESKLAATKYSEVAYFTEVMIPGAIRICTEPTDSAEKLAAHTDQWIELFFRIWMRRRTIVSESSEDRFNALLAALADCPIATSASLQPIRVRETFLPESLFEPSALASAYKSVDAPLIELPFSERHVEYLESRKLRQASTPDDAEWKEFFVALGASNKPRLVPVFATSPQSDPVLAAIKKETDEIGSWNSRKVVTTDFEIHTRRVLNLDFPPEELTVALSVQWTNIAAQATTVSWFYHRARSTEISLSAAALRLPGKLVVKTDRGLVRPEEAIIGTELNRMVATGLFPLVDPERYSATFLAKLGVQEAVDSKWLERRSTLAACETSPEAFISHATAVILVASRLARQQANTRNWIRTAKIYPHGKTRDLLNFDLWKQTGGELEYSSEVVAEVSSVFASVVAVSFTELLDDFFALGDLSAKNGEVVAWLRRASEHVTPDKQGALGLELCRRLSGAGLAYRGSSIDSVEALPVIWDEIPSPTSGMDFVLLPQKQGERAAVIHAANDIGWPRISRLLPQVSAKRQRTVAPVMKRQLQLATKKLVEMCAASGTNPLAGNKLIQQIQSDQLTLIEADELMVVATQRNIEASVSYWVGQEALYFIEEIGLVDAFALAVDAESGSTIAPFFPSIFEGAAAEAKMRPSSTAPKESRSFGASDSEGSASESHESDASDTDSTAEDAQRSNLPSNDPDDPAPDGPRRRLCSLAVPKKRSPDTEESKAKSQAGEERRRKIEEAGEKLLTVFFTKRGFRWKDVTHENCGYDFRVTANGRLYYVELKSSRDRWLNWENSLSQNEFKCASQKGESYVLCVAERVLEPDAALVFIRNPWGITDYFLFDSPWRQVATPPEELFAGSDSKDKSADSADELS